MPKQCQNPPICLNSAKQCQTVPNQCVLIPLGSPTRPQKRSYVHVSGSRTPWRQRCWTSGVPGWVYRGGYTGVGIREGNTGVLPSHRGEGLMTAKRAPETLQGSEWVVMRAGRVRAAGTTHSSPTGASGARFAVPAPLLEQCRLRVLKGEI